MALDKIFIPTDFSEIANNGLAYGAQLAQHWSAKLMIFHTYSLPALNQIANARQDNSPQVAIEATREQFKKLKQEQPLLKKVPSKLIASTGLAIPEIIEKIRTTQSDIVVMGTHKASGLSDYLFGTHTAKILQQASCPVLAIPEKAQFQGINEIVWATDLGPIPYKKELDTLIQFAKSFEASLHLVKVNSDPEADDEWASKGVKKELEEYLAPVSHSFKTIYNEDITTGLHNYIKEEDADILAMMPRKHNLLEKLFNKSITRKMVYHTDIPLLGFHGS